MKYSLLVLLAMLPLAGCTTVAKYEPKAAAGPAKPEDYPIYVYTERMKVPRPHEIIGTMRVGDTPFTVMGGSLEGVLEKLRKNAREKGADAVQLKSVKEPGFTSGNYGAEADLVRFTDEWESLALADAELSTYFKADEQNLDPIEGIWSGNDPMQSRIAIIKNNSKPDRDFIAFILSTRNPTWQKGDKKLDLVRGERPGVYRGDYYFDDYQGKSVAITLRGSPENRFVIRMTDEDTPLVFIRSQPK